MVTAEDAYQDEKSLSHGVSNFPNGHCFAPTMRARGFNDPFTASLFHAGKHVVKFWLNSGT